MDWENFHGTILEAVTYSTMERMKALLEGIPSEKKMTLLSKQDKQLNDSAVLHLAAQYNSNANVVTTILSGLDSEQSMILLSMKDKDECTPLHLAARCNETAYVVRDLLDKLDTEQRMTMLSMKQVNEYTPLHEACQCNKNPDVVTTLLDKLDTEQRMTLLSMKTRSGTTPLHLAARYNDNADVVTALLDKLDTIKRMKLFSMLNRYGNTPLHLAAWFNKNPDVITEFLGKLDINQKISLLSKKTKYGYKPIQLASQYNQKSEVLTTMVFHSLTDMNTDRMTMSINQLDAVQRITLLSMKDKNGYTPLHQAAKYHVTACIITLLLESLDQNQIMTILTLRDNKTNTPLHLAARYNKNVEVTISLLEKIDTKRKMDLLLRRNEAGYTPVHIAAHYHKSPLSLSAMCNSLGTNGGPIVLSMLEIATKDMLVRFLDYLADRATKLTQYSGEKFPVLLWQDEQNNNVLHLAATINHTDFLKKIVSTQDIEEINQALLMRNSDGLIPYYVTKDKDMQKLLAWGETQIDCYPLIVPPRIVIFYSDVDRSSAQEERDSLVDILPTFSMTPVVKLNPSKEEIFSTIRENQKGEVSALIVVIMSHGDSGLVRVRGGDMSINTILKQMNSTQLEHIPKILIIQACQSKIFSPDHYDGASTVIESNEENATKEQGAAGSICCDRTLDASPKIYTEMTAAPKSGAAEERPNQSEENRPAIKHYDLSGPDMIVLAATINKQTAQRNLMIPILANSLKNAKLDEDLHSVFLKTVSKLRKEVRAQVPEYRTTMKYKICLKKIFRTDEKYKSSVKLTNAQKIKLRLQK